MLKNCCQGIFKILSWGLHICFFYGQLDRRTVKVHKMAVASDVTRRGLGIFQLTKNANLLNPSQAITDECLEILLGILEK